MGVPTATIAGSTHVSRAGLDVLAQVGLDDCVTRNPDDYVRTAVALANDSDRRSVLRSSLRERMRRSPLMDGPGLCSRLEQAYRSMWAQWCEAAATDSLI
jgi:predicted O-linked N-acetylglucosamine transferase (SPINDLY family)